MANLVNCMGKSCQARQISRNIIEIWCRQGGISEKMLDWGSDLRTLGSYYANPGQNNQKYMRFSGQPGGIHRNILDFEGQCQENPGKSLKF